MRPRRSLGGAYPDARPRAETQAAEKTDHAETPTVAHADSLGRTFLTVAHNGFKYSNTPAADPPVRSFQPRARPRHRGQPARGIDAKGRVVMRYDYDMLGNRIHQASMEAGERWMLNDVAGKPIRAWDSRGHRFRTDYDPLRRPTDSFVQRRRAARRWLVGRTVYGEGQPEPEVSNLRGKVVQALTTRREIVTSDAYDFKGNLLHSQRRLRAGLQGARWTGRRPCRSNDGRHSPAARPTTP